MQVITEFSLVNSILEPMRQVIGDDFNGYRNHVFRMLNFCHYLMPSMDDDNARKFQIAAAFHDIALWTHNRVDYLEPSIAECRDYLLEHNLECWQDEISLMIDMHHYVRRYKGEYAMNVEIFRQADLVDFSLGWIRFGIPQAFVEQVQVAFPNEGFHKTLVRFSLQQLKRHPLNPLPMMRFRKL